MKGNIHSVETFGAVDGPGIRYVLFLQGCDFRCLYCHNCDSWHKQPNNLKSAEEVICDVLQYKNFIEGITISGGEPLLQMEFVEEVFKLAKQNGFNTCLDTCGSVFDCENVEKMKSLLDVCDYVLLDIKHIDDEYHKKLTGKTNKNVLEFAKFLSERKANLTIRYVLVPTVTDSEECLFELGRFLQTINYCKLDVLPYHNLGKDKFKKLKIKYALEDVPPATKQDVLRAQEIIKKGENYGK